MPNLGYVIGDAIAQARTLLNDPTPSNSGSTLSGTPTLRVIGYLIYQVRGFLNDTNPALYRYSETDLYIYFSDSLLLLRRFRPDLFERGATTATPVYTPAAEFTPFPVDETYLPACVQYVVAAAEMRDDTVQQEQKSTLLAQGFMQNLANSPFRYSDAFLYSCLNEALSETRRLRPDLLHGQIRFPQLFYLPTDAATPFPIDQHYFAPVVDFVVGRARWRNRETSPEPKSAGADYIQTFVQRMRGA